MATAAAIAVPLLRNGDRLTVKEYMRRYEATPEGFRAELIEGVVHVASPTRQEDHGRPQWLVATWTGVYGSMTPGVDGGMESTVLLDQERNRPEPDALLRILPSHGGSSRTV